MNIRYRQIFNKVILVVTTAIFIFQPETSAQYKNAWMSVGSLQNWYSEIGSEMEEQGFVGTQQDGMQWPAIHPYQDMQAMRGTWIGATNFTDAGGNTYPYKVITVGPRNPAFFEYYPLTFETIGKFPLTAVSVDGNLSFSKNVVLDNVDPDMPWDRMIHNVINTGLGITIDRKIFQFGQQYNDNYIIQDLTFTNSGNVDGDDDIELPNQSLTGVYFYFTNRFAVCKQTRYIIGNSSGWGKNTMNSARGDGQENINAYGDPADEQFRAQFSWHGYTPDKTVSYDNIGAPIWAITGDAIPYFRDRSDTVGRLGASQFVGVVTLHADESAVDSTDDITQPSTTAYEASDQALFLAGANSFNAGLMTQEYALMSKGHTPRHAWVVEPSGDFAVQKANPALSSGEGGNSFSNGYGPYIIGPGESVHIVKADAADGISWSERVRVGKLFKQGAISAEQKNREVMKGIDSLFQTFRRAIENYESGYALTQPPRPPKSFNVNSGGDRISLSWDIDPSDPATITGFRIYRAQTFVDSAYYLIHEAGPGERSYDDVSPIRGVDYYYYMEVVGANQSGGPATPAGELVSGRYYTQTYDPARLQRPAGTSLSQIRIVPNPFNISGGNSVRYNDDRIAFYNIPGQCTIKIYTEIGELIKTIEHTNGSGDEFWYQVTSSNQIVVSGIYIAVIIDNVTGEKHIAKFAVIR